MMRGEADTENCHHGSRKSKHSRSPDRKKSSKASKKSKSSNSKRSRSRSLSQNAGVSKRKRRHEESSKSRHVNAKKSRKQSISQSESSRSLSGSRSRSLSSNASTDSNGKRSSLPSPIKAALQQKQKDSSVRKLEKEKMKLYETPEEKRARRLQKKQQKELKRRQKLGWDEEQIGYTAVDNPFGDPNLLSSFVWKKKEEQEASAGSRPSRGRKETSPINTVEELEKVKKRRLEREKEKQERQDSIVAEQRGREREYFAQWESQEDSFHLNQAKLRSTIRIQDGRAKAIDLLAKYISTEEVDQQLAVEMHDPQKFIEGLKINDLEDLLEDIKVYMELEQGKNAEYWRDITIVVHDEIARVNASSSETNQNANDDEVQMAERRESMSRSVSNEVNKIFAGKSELELKKLKTSVENKLKTQTNIDTVYWESLLKKLIAQISRVRLTERHKETLRQKLFKLKHEQGVEHSKPLFPVVRPKERKNDNHKSDKPQQVSSKSAQFEEMKETTTCESKEDKPQLTVLTDENETDLREEVYESGRYSPRLLEPGDLPAGTVLLEPEDELNKLKYARQKFLGTGNADIDADRQLMQKVRDVGGMLDDEDGVNNQAFSTEQNLNQEYLWADKYRPRKPRYFNRVHTGYEWNKYNQTHYDPENPPPKIVQGYKFNIFYPDLIDKRQTPRYSLEPIPNESDFVVLRFSSGPPYEDIAFKIVNREWEYGHKHGYKCQFSNDIFQLWFKFKLYKYRR
ncbi:splicing factor Cactin-like [Convolutriloba macropyga]|uniref:splicing factor Cactin-like n=1 Tax=Convolutriloba macropyga TaxID=536237 RepID=UPI003F5239C7